MGGVSQSQRLWPMAALSAAFFAHIGFLNPYLPLWLKDMGYGLLAISVMTSLPSATRTFAPYLWGWLSDHTGQRVKLIRWCGTAALLASLLLQWQWGTVGLFAVLFLLFFHTSGMMPLAEVVLAQHVGQSGGFDARRYGRVRLWGSLGFLVTVLWAGAWFERHGMGSFPDWAAITLLGVVVSVWAMPDHKEPLHAHHERLSVWPVLRQPRVAWFFVAGFLHVLSHLLIYVFFSLYLDELGYGKEVIGMLWAAAVVVEIAWFFTQGRWLPLLSLEKWLWLASLLMLLRMVATAAAAQWLWVLVLAQTVHAITFAAHHSVCVAWLNQHFPGRLRARGQAIYAVVCYGASGMLGGVLGGLISTYWGLNAVFWLSTLVALGATLAARVIVRLQTS